MTNERILELSQAVLSARGGAAHIWEYKISHGELTIRLEKSGSSENLHLVCSGCEYIAGPFSWRNSQIEFQSSHDDRVKLSDTRNGFVLQCAIVRVFPNVEPVYEGRGAMGAGDES